MEQFLTDRATVPSNVEDIRNRLLFRAESQGKSVKQVLEEFLIEEGYDQVEGVDIPGTAIALCRLWQIDDEKPTQNS